MANSTKISEYSTTASNNTSIDSIDIDENCAASGINNAIRSVLKHQADAFTQGTPIALDQTNNNVGIGTTTIEDFGGGHSTLEVAGTTTSEGGVFKTATSDSAGTGTTGTEMIMFTDSTNGGSINVVSADPLRLMTANTARMTIDSSGNVGIGTTSPANFGGTTLQTNHGSTYSANLVSSGAYTLQMIASAAHGAMSMGARSNHHVAFTTNDTERMRILSGGDLHLGGTGQSDGKLTITGKSSAGAWGTKYITDVHSGTYYFINFCKNESGVPQVGSITSNGSSTSYNTSSDHRLKEAIVDMTGAIDRVKALAPKRFNFIADPDTTVDGFIAHEAQAVVPEAVTGTKDAMRDEEYEVTPAVIDDDGNVVTEAVMGTRSVPDYQGIDQSKLVPLLTGALQEAIAKIEALEARVTALEA